MESRRSLTRQQAQNVPGAADMKEGTRKTRANKIQGPRPVLEAHYNVQSSQPPCKTEHVTPTSKSRTQNRRGPRPKLRLEPLLEQTRSVPSRPPRPPPTSPAARVDSPHVRSLPLQVLCLLLTQSLQDRPQRACSWPGSTGLLPLEGAP